MPWEVTAQTAIGVVLTVAAITKIGSKPSVAAFLQAMSVPRAIAAPIGVAVPAVEGLLGVLLMLRIGGSVVIAATVTLCASFALTLIIALARGVTAGCRCFGALDGERLTPVAVVRAVMLAITGGALVAWGDGTVPLLPMTGETVPAVGLGILAALVYVAVFAMLGHVYEFERGRRRVIAQLKARQPIAEELGT